MHNATCVCAPGYFCALIFFAVAKTKIENLNLSSILLVVGGFESLFVSWCVASSAVGPFQHHLSDSKTWVAMENIFASLRFLPSSTSAVHA